MGWCACRTASTRSNSEWALAPGQSFDAPESVLTYSHEGLNGMSRNMHAFVKEHIVRGEWKHKERPIVVNNWEATYFQFTEKKILAIAKEGARLGAELFVLDDGWFGKRNSDQSSLGDWWVNKKLPSGIDGLARKSMRWASNSACGWSRRWSTPTATSTARTRTGR